MALPMTLFAEELESEMTGEGEDISTVVEAKDMLDESKVTLEGYVVEKVEKNIYVFRDDTGQVDATIDFHVRYGRKLEPDERVRIDAEIARDEADQVIIDVKKLKKLD